VGEHRRPREASQLAANLRNWEARVDNHVASAFYDVEGLVRSRRPRLDPITLAGPRRGPRDRVLHEFAVDVWRRFPFMTRHGRWWRIPGDPIPLMFSLRARSG